MSNQVELSQPSVSFATRGAASLGPPSVPYFFGRVLHTFFLFLLLFFPPPPDPMGRCSWLASYARRPGDGHLLHVVRLRPGEVGPDGVPSLEAPIRQNAGARPKTFLGVVCVRREMQLTNRGMYMFVHNMNDLCIYIYICILWLYK